MSANAEVWGVLFPEGGSALPWSQVRLGAALLLALYILLAAIFSQRELSFLAGQRPKERRTFIVLDLLIQVSVLAILLPCILSGSASLGLFVTILVGFLCLWGSVIWNGAARSMYTYRLMLEFRSSLAPKSDAASDAKKGPAPGGLSAGESGQEKDDG